VSIKAHALLKWKFALIQMLKPSIFKLFNFTNHNKKV
jgi:hypothetical protein